MFELLNYQLTINLAKDCNEKESCTFDNITSIDGDDINCYGYRSCENARLIEATIPGTINCEGAFSCYQSLSIEMVLSSDSNIDDSTNTNCDGLFACSNVNLIETSSPYVLCRAEKACVNSTIVFGYEGQQLTCVGDQSCANGVITNVRRDYFNGHLSGHNAILTASNDSDSTHIFTGAFSGYNATIYCGNKNNIDFNYICNINCYGNGCTNLNLQCIGNCTFAVVCYGSEESEACPNGFNLNSIIDMIYSYENLGLNIEIPWLNDNSQFSTLENSYSLCSYSNTSDETIHCDDYQECQDISLNNNGSICCTASIGCRDSTSIISNLGDKDSSNSNSNVSIRCDGSRSCYIIPLIESRGAGNLYLSGYRASWRLRGILETTNEFDIFCTGVQGCYVFLIQNARNVYCTAKKACGSTSNDALIYNISNNVYGYGDEALLNITLDLIRGNVYCIGRSSCANTNIENVFGSVYGIGYEVLKNATIANTTNVSLCALHLNFLLSFFFVFFLNVFLL